MEFATFPRREEHLLARADVKRFLQQHVRILCFEEAKLSIKALVDTKGTISLESGNDVRFYGFFLGERIRKMITFL